MGSPRIITFESREDVILRNLDQHPKKYARTIKRLLGFLVMCDWKEPDADGFKGHYYTDDGSLDGIHKFFPELAELNPFERDFLRSVAWSVYCEGFADCALDDIAFAWIDGERVL